MNCLRCGRETVGEQVFCQDCQLGMEKYPVRPGTLVQLPRRRETSAAKKTSKRKTVSLEDQVMGLRKLVRILLVSLLVCLILIGLLAYPAITHLTEEHFAIGQNYNTVTPTTASDKD